MLLWNEMSYNNYNNNKDIFRLNELLDKEEYEEIIIDEFDDEENLYEYYCD